MAPNNTGDSSSEHWMSFKIPQNYQFVIYNYNNNNYSYGQAMQVRILSTTIVAGTEVNLKNPD